jgi:hypothetical protein
MNQAFDLQRWGLLVRKHWSDNRNKYTLSLGAIAALLLLWFGFLILVDKRGAMNKEGQLFTYYIGLFLTGALYASFLFGDLANKPKALNFMSVPASQLEKVLCMALYCVVAFWVCYTAIFYFVDFIMIKVSNAVQLARLKEGATLNYPFVKETVFNVFGRIENTPRDNPFNPLTVVLLLFFAVQGAYALGSIYFPTYSFIKTTISLLLIILLFIFLMAKVLLPILPKGSFGDSLTKFYIYDRDYSNRSVILLPSWTDNVIFGFFKYLLAPAFWVVTYFRLKEKEV